MTGGAGWAVLLAAGRGLRYGERKQFLPVGGERMVDRVVRTATESCAGVVLVLPPGVEWDGPAVDAVVAGGATRAASVRAGLSAVPDDVEVVVVHDAAHPLAQAQLFTAVQEAVRAGADAAVPTLPLTEVLKRVDGDVVVGEVPREALVLVQTPHAFRAAALRAAHDDAPEAVEDSQLVRERGGVVVCVPGDPANLHVTNEAERLLVERLLG